MSVTRSSAPRQAYWKTQLPIDYLDTSLTINTPENVTVNLSAGAPARIKYVVVEQTNNGATAETIVLHITINGTVYNVSGSLDSGSRYYVYVDESLATGTFNFAYGAKDSFLTFGAPNLNSNVANFFTAVIGLITVEQTTTVDGTSAQIEVNIVWDKLTSVSV